MGKTTEVISGLDQARRAGSVYAPPSETLGDFDLPTAYDLQELYVEAWGASDEIAGFKAAATGAQIQQQFGLPGPISGVLFEAGAREAGATIARSDFRTLLLETEFCFRLSETLHTPFADKAALGECIADCRAAIELADPGFDRAFRGQDLVATNAACGGWILGGEWDWRNAEIDSTAVVLSGNGDNLHEELAGSVMGSQLDALYWLVNQILMQGYTIRPEHVLLTGSIGPAHPARPGSYAADFGAAGRIEFAVQ